MKLKFGREWPVCTESDSETEREKIAVDFSAAPESTTVKHSERKKKYIKNHHESRINVILFIIWMLFDIFIALI